MNIRNALLEPPVQLKSEAIKIAGYAAKSGKNFAELIDCFLDNEYRLQQRAAYCVSMATEKNKKLIEPYIPVLIQQLSRKDVHNAVLRNSLRILQKVQIPEMHRGGLMNACFNFIESQQTPIAIKAFALTILGNLAESVPEIKDEIKLIIDFNINHESAAYKVRAREVLKKINKQK